MENNEELQSLINDLRGKLGDNTRVELIDFDESNELPETFAELQGDPSQALPDELVSMILEGANEIMRVLEGGEVPTVEITPIDESEESQEAMRALSGRIGMQRQLRCYHYILDSTGQPVHSEDEEEVQRFQKRNKDTLIENDFNFRGLPMKITTYFVVHNPYREGDEMPGPHWLTEFSREDTLQSGARYFSHSFAEAKLVHHRMCREVRERCAAMYHIRRPSPIRREAALKRIAAGQDVLRRKPRKESPERWFQRTLKEAFDGMEGPEIAHALGLSSFRRKRGQQ